MDNGLKTMQIEGIPVWATYWMDCGEDDSLTDDDIRLIEDFYARYEEMGMRIWGVYPHEDESGAWEPYFSYFPAFGPGSEVVDCDVVYVEI